MDRATSIATSILLVLATAGFHNPLAAELDAVALDLVVTTCAGTRLESAAVEVAIYRPGSGVVSTNFGITRKGQIEFKFCDLEPDDEAHVTVTPNGGSPDTGHLYIYVGDCSDAPAIWDLGSSSLGPCDDRWWDEEQGIINTIVGE